MKEYSRDRWVSTLLCLLSVCCGLFLFVLIFFLLRESWPVLSGNGWLAFLHSDGWFPQEGLYGMMPMILASLAVTLGAVLIALPLGLASAIFLQFYAYQRIEKSYRLLLNLLAGIPSVVFGLWGLTTIVPMIASVQPPGASLLAAILVLALMILPTIALTSSAALSAVSHEILNGALVLGMTRKTQIISVALPAARPGIISGVLLAAARALGETMVVVMIAGNVVQNPTGLFQPVRALTANIALEMAYAMGDHRASLFASGLLLTLLVWLLATTAARFNRVSYLGRHYV